MNPNIKDILIKLPHEVKNYGRLKSPSLISQRQAIVESNISDEEKEIFLENPIYLVESETIRCFCCKAKVSLNQSSYCGKIDNNWCVVPNISRNQANVKWMFQNMCDVCTFTDHWKVAYDDLMEELNMADRSYVHVILSKSHGTNLIGPYDYTSINS